MRKKIAILAVSLAVLGGCSSQPSGPDAKVVVDGDKNFWNREECISNAAQKLASDPAYKTKIVPAKAACVAKYPESK